MSFGAGGFPAPHSRLMCFSIAAVCCAFACCSSPCFFYSPTQLKRSVYTRLNFFHNQSLALLQHILYMPCADGSSLIGQMRSLTYRSTRREALGDCSVLLSLCQQQQCLNMHIVCCVVRRCPEHHSSVTPIIAKDSQQGWSRLDFISENVCVVHKVSNTTLEYICLLFL